MQAPRTLGPGGVPLAIGVIADTHGLLRPEATARLRGCDVLVHAGDVGSPGVLAALRDLGVPLAVIRGNVDAGAWAADLPETCLVELAGHLVYVLHDVHALDFAPAAAGVRVVVSGHSHQPGWRQGPDGTWYLNPGSAGPRRFRLPVTVASLHLAPVAGPGPAAPSAATAATAVAARIHPLLATADDPRGAAPR